MLGSIIVFMNREEDKIGYQFTAVPTNLYQCCDINVRSMLFTLVQLSSYYADCNGWFFRTNDDLRVQAKLSENLVRATLSTLYRIGVVDIKTVGKGKSKTPNYFKLNFDKFLHWEDYNIEDCYKHPDFEIETDNYKDKGWQPSYLEKLEFGTDNNTAEVTASLPTPLPTSLQSEDNIENTDNKENKFSERSKQVEGKSNQFEEYKKQEDALMDKLYNVSTWTDFQLFRKRIKTLISTAPSEKVAEKTRTRYKKIEEGKIKFLKSIISKQPYNSFYTDFYREYDCGWLGKDNKQSAVQPQPKKAGEEDPHADLREIFRINGWGEPDIAKYDKQKQEGQEFHPLDDDEDNLPF